MRATDNLLFVYGTLMTGCDAEGLLRGLRRWPARTRGRLYRMRAGYPALVMDPAAGWIEGELVELDTPGRLVVLDNFEGVGEGLYAREAIRVAYQGRSATCWAYVMSAKQVRDRKGALLKSGSWRRLRPGRG